MPVPIWTLKMSKGILSETNSLKPFGLFLYFLTFVAKIYQFLINTRNKRYKLKSKFISGSKIISVGNITLGGTGKTPLVAWIANYFAQKDQNVGIVLRGYGRKNKIKEPILHGVDFKNNELETFGDECLLLSELCPHAKIMVCADRIKGIQRLEKEQNCSIIILDDGFQQLHIEKQMDIICLDYVKPFGNGYVLPRGNLREPLVELNRASHYVFSKGTPRKRALNKLKELVGDAKEIFFCDYVIIGGYMLNDRLNVVDLNGLKNQNVLILSAIGDPDSFQGMLNRFDIYGEVMAFPDHFDFKRSDIERVNRYVEDNDIDSIIITEKDAQKLKGNHFKIPCCVIEAEIRPSREFEEELDYNILRK
ncbi:MAG: Tetraacyldisaccharide 4'-kinase [uncultured bacterium]|nr:MAG: Tetraacyldisaccharide 4'-kinase [uncultured bacterium]